MPSGAIDWIVSLWPTLKDFCNSTFFTAIAGSFAGAIAGAYGAQIIAERGKQREELFTDIRAINAASMIAFNLCTSLISLKEEHVLRLKTEFDRQKEEVIKLRHDLSEARPARAITIKYDFQTLPFLHLPSKLLRNYVLDKISSVSRTTMFYLTLQQILNDLNISIGKRNDLIELFKRNQNVLSEEQRAILYFGLPYDGGSVDEEYSGVVQAIYEQLDDAIFFSYQLCSGLVENGNKARERFKKMFGAGAPKINTVNFSKSFAKGLIPSKDKYIDWLRSITEEGDIPNEK